MTPVPIPPDEAARLVEVAAYERIVAEVRADIQAITRLAAEICGTPIGLVSLVGADHQTFAAQVGVAVGSTPRDSAFCAHAVAGRHLLEVPDATADTRFSANPLVTGDPGIRFYAGHPLVTGTDHAIGALCVVDHAPRMLSPHQRTALALLAEQVIRRLDHQRMALDLARLVHDRDWALEQAKAHTRRIATSERRLALVLASAQAGTWDWDLTTGLITFDARFAEVLDLEAPGPLPVAVVFQHADDAQLEALHVALSQLFEQHVDRLAHDVELRVKGESRWVRVRGALVTEAGESGPARRATGLAVDFTAERKRDDVQRQAQRLDSIGALAAGVAHEINTPLQFVGHNLDFLASHAATVAAVVDQLAELKDALHSGSDVADAAARWRDTMDGADLSFIRDEFAAAIVESIEGIDRVTHIVRALKEFAHPGGAGREVVSMNQMIENAITLTRHEWKFVATVETDLDPHLPAVAWAAHECGQLLVNLIVNAAHAIQAAVSKGQKGVITARTRYVGGLVEIRLSDTGCGIPTEIRDRIFDAFFTTKPVGKGTGQGLSTALAIVKRHGGTIDVQSELGHGTTFVVRLPSSVGQRAA